MRITIAIEIDSSEFYGPAIQRLIRDVQDLADNYDDHFGGVVFAGKKD